MSTNAVPVLHRFALIVVFLAGANGQTATSRLASARNAFLSTLDQHQRQHALFAFDDQKQRARWSNFPVVMVPKAGISLKDMSDRKRSAAMTLVASALSRNLTFGKDRPDYVQAGVPSGPFSFAWLPGGWRSGGRAPLGSIALLLLARLALVWRRRV